MVKFHTIQAVEECRGLKDEKHIMGLIYLRTNSAQNILWSPCIWILQAWILGAKYHVTKMFIKINNNFNKSND